MFLGKELRTSQIDKHRRTYQEVQLDSWKFIVIITIFLNREIMKKGDCQREFG